jgi:hypothetical protein
MTRGRRAAVNKELSDKDSKQALDVIDEEDAPERRRTALCHRLDL